MQRTYRLVKPVVAFQQETDQVVTIPAGSVVELVWIRAGIGIQAASWNGQPVMVYEEDLAANSLKLVPSSDLPHPT